MFVEFTTCVSPSLSWQDSLNVHAPNSFNDTHSTLLNTLELPPTCLCSLNTDFNTECANLLPFYKAQQWHALTHTCLLTRRQNIRCAAVVLAFSSQTRILIKYWSGGCWGCRGMCRWLWVCGKALSQLALCSLSAATFLCQQASRRSWRRGKKRRKS